VAILSLVKDSKNYDLIRKSLQRRRDQHEEPRLEAERKWKWALENEHGEADDEDDWFSEAEKQQQRRRKRSWEDQHGQADDEDDWCSEAEKHQQIEEVNETVNGYDRSWYLCEVAATKIAAARRGQLARSLQRRRNQSVGSANDCPTDEGQQSSQQQNGGDGSSSGEDKEGSGNDVAPDRPDTYDEQQTAGSSQSRDVDLPDTVNVIGAVLDASNCDADHDALNRDHVFLKICRYIVNIEAHGCYLSDIGGRFKVKKQYVKEHFDVSESSSCDAWVRFPMHIRSGTVFNRHGRYGFIAQDKFEANMFVLPQSCADTGGIPDIGTRILYSVTIDSRTGRERAGNVWFADQPS
jgi:hypothetical protein